ncbi:MAG: GNAT family N-acetyltransferase [Anaerolineae bacterium]|nr:GNAT family N-acetyltransferase [Anaerolineae bacterium]
MIEPSMLLRGERIKLTALTQDDLPTIVPWYENTHFLRLLDARPAYPQTEATLKDWLQEMDKAKNAFLLGIRLLDADQLIGYIELEGILWIHQTGWIGIGIGEPDYWNRGYGREAMDLALAFCFDELNLHRVQLTVFDYNKRAIALYEKLGFQHEGTFREFLHRDGQRYDMHLYGLLRREWQTS